MGDLLGWQASDKVEGESKDGSEMQMISSKITRHLRLLGTVDVGLYEIKQQIYLLIILGVRPLHCIGSHNWPRGVPQ